MDYVKKDILAKYKVTHKNKNGKFDMYGKIIQEKESDLGCESTGFVIDVWFLCFFIFLRVESSNWNRAFDPCP